MSTNVQIYSKTANMLLYMYLTIFKYEHIFPYLLVNIGSGVSILKVESERDYQRIGGSTIGGATLWGLGSLLTDARGFDEIMELAERGDNRNVDMLIKDIYGGNYDALGLNNELIASTLGKATRSEMDCQGGAGCETREQHLAKFKQEDLVKSILLMICYDVTQIASLHARIHGIKRVYFGGYFIRNCRLTMKFLKHGIQFWSQVYARN
jgi:type II pantothenate kinase